MMLRNGLLRGYRSIDHSIRLGLSTMAAVVMIWSILVGPLHAAPSSSKPSSPKPQREQLTLAVDMSADVRTGDLDTMIDKHVIRVLTTHSKTFYFIDKGTQRGATYDAFRQFEVDLNKKLAKEKKQKQKHIKVRVVFVPVDRDELLPALAAGKGDIAASNLTITEERAKLVDFTAPTYRNVSELLVSGPKSPSISSVDELSGQVVFVRKSSSYYESLTTLNRRFTAEKKSAVIIKEAPESLEDEDLIEMVNAGMLPFIVVDKHVADFWKQVFPKIKVHDGVALRTGADIAWAIRKGSPKLKAVLDEFVTRNSVGSSATGNALLARYLKNAKYVKDAGSEAERKKFLALIQFFQKYGDRYDVDWLLMAAQGYQESALNQNARSPVGAIGVMQVMPATGKDLGVGDIAQVEANIHAGIKYMRWMIDTYYADEPMTKVDKALFAFASYNAGAGRISQLRKEAAKRKLDPNVWFRNVEYVAAEKIGAETVTYVSNIYKYYITYRLIMDDKMEREKAMEQLKGEGKGTP